MSSNEKLANGTTGYKITKDDLAQINRRNLLGFQDGWNYERMQHSGYLWIILPTLRKLYGDGTPELKKPAAPSAHRSSTPQTSSTRSSPVSIWRSRKRRALRPEAVAGLKTGLMGPLASIGDSIFGSLLPTIFGALAANMAMNGNPLGIFIWVAVNILVDWFRCKQTHMAYEQGMKLVTTMSDRLNALTDAASVMGVFMVGALVATNVGIVIAAKPVIGGVTVDLQNICNMICPKLVPAALVGFVYWLLGKKGMTSTKAIFIVLVLSIALGAFGIICGLSTPYCHGI
ncbi:MAG: PTS system mannose/fructose/sorbose family transporter subunit IID [Collinsella sp.]